MKARLGDEKAVADQAKVPRTVESGLESRAAKHAVFAVFPGPGHGAHRFFLQIERSNQMILTVGDIKRFARQSHSLRIIERGFVESSVLFARLADAGKGDLLAVQVRNNNTVVCAVGDKETAAAIIGQNFSRKEQRTVAFFFEPGQLETKRLFVECLFLTRFLD